MFTFQEKKRSIWAVPRPVVERIVSLPRMSFIASSMGRVTVAIISSAGITPLSAMMTTRGKSVSGKTDEPIFLAAYPPPRQRASTRKTIEMACLTANLPIAAFILSISWRRRWLPQSLAEYADFCFPRQSVSSGRDDLISWLEDEALDLDGVALTKPNLDGLLDCLLAANQVDHPFAALILDDASRWNCQAITALFGDDSHADELSGPQSGFRRDGNINRAHVRFRINPIFNERHRSDQTGWRRVGSGGFGYGGGVVNVGLFWNDLHFLAQLHRGHLRTGDIGCNDQAI